MSQAVISNNQSIKIADFVVNYSQATTGSPGVDIYTVGLNEYIELNFAYLGNTLSSLRIKYQNGLFVDIIPFGSQQYIGQLTPNKVVLSPGTSLNIVNISGVAVPVFKTGVRFINSP